MVFTVRVNTVKVGGLVMRLTIEAAAAGRRVERIRLLSQPGSDLTTVYSPEIVARLQSPEARRLELEKLEHTQEHLRTRPNM